LVEEIFEIVQSLNRQEGVSILLAEQNTNIALRYAHYGYILESGRVVMDGTAKDLRENPDVREFYLGVAEEGQRSFRNVRSYRRRKRWLSWSHGYGWIRSFAVCQLANLPDNNFNNHGVAMSDRHFDVLECRAVAEREAEQFKQLPEFIRGAIDRCPAHRDRLGRIDPAKITSPLLAGLLISIVFVVTVADRVCLCRRVLYGSRNPPELIPGK